MAPEEGVSMAELDALALSCVLVVPSVFWAIAAPVSPNAAVNTAICFQCVAGMAGPFFTNAYTHCLVPFVGSLPGRSAFVCRRP
jgi:hypothetical protein